MIDIYGTSSALEEIESEFPQVLTFDKSDYPCIIGARNDGSTLGDGGFALSAGLEVVCRRELFSTLPTTRDNFTVNGKVQKIISMIFSHDQQVIVFSTEDVNKDA
jgi:hypothetical protein